MQHVLPRYKFTTGRRAQASSARGFELWKGGFGKLFRDPGKITSPRGAILTAEGQRGGRMVRVFRCTQEGGGRGVFYPNQTLM